MILQTVVKIFAQLVHFIVIVDLFIVMCILNNSILLQNYEIMQKS